MNDNKQKIEELAQRILVLSRNKLIVNLRFMDSAISRLVQVPEGIETVATNGEKLFYNPTYILKLYQQEQELPVRVYLHMLFHCIYQHFFVGEGINVKYWDLACDIAVEHSIYELNLQCVKIKRDDAQQAEINKLKKELDFLTAEKIYRYYLNYNPEEREIERLQNLFKHDDHSPWYQTEGEVDQTTVVVKVVSTAKLSEMWKEVSEEMQMALSTFMKDRGDTAGTLIQNLQEVNREKYDYAQFLKKFAVMGEVMKINDDEFDYIFYTYGLAQYKKMPLIEPLEYKEQKRIKEFVIAIDTSGSVVGEEVQAFVQKTYNVLKSTESFFQKINLHIIQCDAEIQEAVKITTQEEFDSYLKNMKIRGLGGTDFRPVFTCVNELIANKEFTNLKGLIYFTDGYGVFPEKKPEYETAFVFIKDFYEDVEVPPWAIKLLLQKDEI